MASRVLTHLWLVLMPLLLPQTAAALLSKRKQQATHEITFVQWNMHGECFVECQDSEDSHCDKSYPACKNNATAYLSGLLRGSSHHISDMPDFAGIEELGDQQFLSDGLDKSNWAHFTHLCGGKEGYGHWPTDTANLFYNTKRWDVLQTGGSPYTALGGCMERVTGPANDSHTTEDSSVDPNYRAFIVQAFKHKSDGTELIVVVAHNPHINRYEQEIQPLRHALEKMQRDTGVKNVVLVADTNWNFPLVPHYGRSSERIIKDIYPDADSIAHTELHPTCCSPTYLAAFDRIIAAGFPGAASPISTILPFADGRPPWVVLNMHDPIAGTLSFTKSTASSSS